MKPKKQVTQSNVERFYKWMQDMGNIYLNDSEQMVKAFHKVATN